MATVALATLWKHQQPNLNCDDNLLWIYGGFWIIYTKTLQTKHNLC